MFAYLVLLNGARSGAKFLLEKESKNLIGRDVACEIVLTDPLCSRVHATVDRDEDGWWIRDLDSRNGTYLNDQKVDEARLLDGCELRLGSAEFRFHIVKDPPLDVAHPNVNLSQTLVFDRPIELETKDDSSVLPWLPSEAQSHDFLVSYQLCIRLLGCVDPNEVTSLTLQVLRGATGADVAGFLWISEDGQLKPRSKEPRDGDVELVDCDQLTTSVCFERRTVWTKRPGKKVNLNCLAHLADAICVPLLNAGEVLGAVHLYKTKGGFNRQDYQFAKSTVRIMATALARAQQQASLQVEHQRLADKTGDFNELIGESEPMRHLKENIRRVARATGSLLVRGESGAGKELVARAVHRFGTRSDRPMLSVNCAAIPRELMESQLFGHTKGAFTGADKAHVGWFQQADTGTLFLDEIGELTLDGQAKLLRILDGYPFLPVGGTKEIAVDVRVIAATNRDLRQFVHEKKFREDLYYRLTVFELYIPPLRERGKDVELLIDLFFDRFKATHGRRNLQLSDAARQRLIDYHWPGNVRQLRNVIDSAVVMAVNSSIQPDELGLHDSSADSFDTLRLDAWEKKLIEEALIRSKDNVPDAARLLGISRATLYRKIDEYNVDR